jgi:hypothetical protein
MNKLILLSIILLSGCTYHYHLNIVIGDNPPPPASQSIEEQSSVEPAKVNPTKPADLSPLAQTAPMSIEPGQFTASQTKGGNMINIVLNINSAKPTEVTTDTSVSGIPGL